MNRLDDQRKPVAIKNLAELKRFIQPGVEFKTLYHANHADMVGLTRVVTTVQTTGFYSKIKNQPEHPFSTCNYGKGFYTDFGIPYEDGVNKAGRPQKQNTDEQNFQHMEHYCFRLLLDYYRLLCRWKDEYAPQAPEDGYHPRFVEASQKLSLIEYLLDELLCGDIQARASVVIEYGEEVRKIEQRMAELAAAD